MWHASRTRAKGVVSALLSRAHAWARNDDLTYAPEILVGRILRDPVRVHVLQ